MKACSCRKSTAAHISTWNPDWTNGISQTYIATGNLEGGNVATTLLDATGLRPHLVHHTAELVAEDVTTGHLDDRTWNEYENEALETLLGLGRPYREEGAGRCRKGWCL